MRFLVLYAQSLNAIERHVILLLMIATFIMHSVLLLLCHHKFAQHLFSLTLKDQTHLEANFTALFAPLKTSLKNLTQSLGRYGGLLKIRFGFKGFWMHK